MVAALPEVLAEPLKKNLILGNLVAVKTAFQQWKKKKDNNNSNQSKAPPMISLPTADEEVYDSNLDDLYTSNGYEEKKTSS